MSKNIMSMMRQASKVTTQRHYRLLRGRFEKAVRASMPEALAESAIQTFRRAVWRSWRKANPV